MPPLQLFYLMSTFAILAIAWWKGGAPERSGALVLFVAYLATGLVKTIELGGLRVGVALIDVALALTLVWLAMRSGRWWLLLAAANQLLVVMAHATAVIDPTLGLRVSVASRWLFGLIVLYALLAGVFERWLAGEASVLRMTKERRSRMQGISTVR